MELTRTCCFEFDRMLRADGKRVHLSTFLFYFMVAGFTYWSLLPQVDKMRAPMRASEPAWGTQELGLHCSCTFDRLFSVP